MTSIYDFTARGMDGRVTSLGSYRGKTLLIVNVASKCGLTPQYEGLEALYRKFAEKGSLYSAFPAINSGIKSRGTPSKFEISVRRSTMAVSENATPRPRNPRALRTPSRNFYNWRRAAPR
jgi:Glutathione peroxidase